MILHRHHEANHVEPTLVLHMEVRIMLMMQMLSHVLAWSYGMSYVHILRKRILL